MGREEGDEEGQWRQTLEGRKGLREKGWGGEQTEEEDNLNKRLGERKGEKIENGGLSFSRWERGKG